MKVLQAVKDIKHIGGKQCFVSGMTAFVSDLKDLAEKEEPVYVLIAVVLACIVLAIFMDSWIIPVLFIAGIGMAILYNLGSNVFMGEISYITKALSAVLQLGVTMDYSIFLWHSYEEQQQIWPDDKNKAMSHAIASTRLTSVAGSSLTTIAGFLALCFMTFTLGIGSGHSHGKRRTAGSHRMHDNTAVTDTYVRKAYKQDKTQRCAAEVRQAFQYSDEETGSVRSHIHRSADTCIHRLQSHGRLLQSG